MPTARRFYPLLLVALLITPILVTAGTITSTGAAPVVPRTSAVSGIPATALATGRLAERALPLVDLATHDGASTAPRVTPATWRQALHQLAVASVADEQAVRLRASLALARPRPSGLHHLAVLDLAYEALPQGSPDQPFDPATAVLDRHQATLATVLSPVIHDGAHATFVLPNDLLVTDGPVELAVDLGDGAGLRPVRPDTPLTAHYRTTGPHQATMRLIDVGGGVRWSNFTVNVTSLDLPAPDQTWPLTASVAHDGAVATGSAYILLAPGHTQVTDPVVVIEGFDLDDSYGWAELYALLNQQNLLEDLRTAGKDAVVLDFTSATAPIQRNAYLVAELLQTIDGTVPAGTTYPLIGASMGGLVGRFALAWLEQAGGGHHVDTYFSFDAPQTGANVPLGLQCWVEFFASESSEAAYLLSRLDTPAARQMLAYHHLMVPQGIAGPDPLFDELRADLAALGDWPQQPRLVAVINGSGTGQGQSFGPAAQLIDYEYESFLVDIVGNVWALPDENGSQLIFHGLIDQIWPLPDTEWTVTAHQTRPWDSAPGGWRNSLAQAGDVAAPYGDIVALHDNHGFIPAVCAVALEDVDPYAPVDGYAELPPFDTVYLPAENQEHIFIGPESRQWFLDEILGTATASPDVPTAAVTLQDAAPNPFNPRTTLAFALPRAGDVHLQVVDLAGRRVRTLVDEALPAGEHSAVWDGCDDTGRGVAAGVYLAVVEHAGQRVATRMALVR